MNQQHSRSQAVTVGCPREQSMTDTTGRDLLIARRGLRNRVAFGYSQPRTTVLVTRMCGQPTEEM